MGPIALRKAPTPGTGLVDESCFPEAALYLTSHLAQPMGLGSVWCLRGSPISAVMG